MADDLDDFLDEVESQFCCSASTVQQTAFNSMQTKQNGANEPLKQPRKQPPKETQNDDIDAILQEILEDDYQPVKSHEATAGKTLSPDSCSQTVFKKCCPVFLGGSLVEFGVGTSVSHRACNQLRCTSCDFRVAVFDDHEWDSTCDYLFFRNNMPDCHKLRAKLKRRRGGRAYACQCSWNTVTFLSELSDHHQLKWVCGKHNV